VTSIVQQADEFRKRNISVLVVTFGTEEMGLRWKRDTGCIFPVLSDATRFYYKLFGFPSSVKLAWGIPAQQWYAEQLRAGRSLHSLVPGDDPHQLGGDVVINSHRVVTFIHRCRSSADRPTVNQLLQTGQK